MMDTKKLRQKILDLAIHGKLVPQDPNDEPASVLLERIRKEKEQLIKEGKIKAPKKSKSASDTSHYPKEGPWTLPDGWVWTTLDNICSIRGGKRIPKGKTFASERTQHVYIRVTDMKDQSIDMSDLKYIDDDVYNEISRYIIEKEDLYLTIAGTIGRVGEIPAELHRMNLTENAARLTNIVCNKKYLMYALLTDVAQNHFSLRFHQVAQPKLSIETASSTPIALPPLPEQERIVEAIQTWLSCIHIIE
jgi:type I restriction enzyme S subunit